MVRCAAALFVMCGCNYVLSLDPLDPLPPAQCGPYGEPQPVMIEPTLAQLDAHDFSVTQSGMYGGIVVEQTAVPDFYGLRYDITADTWLRDITTKLPRYRAHRTVDDKAFGTNIDQESQGVELSLAGTTWAPVAPTLPFDRCFRMHVGNEYDDYGGTATLQLRRAVIVMTPSADTGCSVGKAQLVIANMLAPVTPLSVWSLDLPRTEPINKSKIVPSQAVMTQDLFTIVYAGTDGGSSDLYVTTLDRSGANNFPTGQIITSLSTADDEDEPWIDADCSTIWFRRNGVLMMATKQ